MAAAFLLFAALPPASGQSTDALQERAKSLLQRGQYAGAVTAFTEWSKREPESVAAYTGLGVAYAKEEAYPQAIAAYGRALKIDSRCLPALANLGLAYFKQANFRAAIVPLERAASLAHDNSQLTTLLAMSYYSLHRYQDASRQFERLYQTQQADASGDSREMLTYLLAESYLRSHQAAAWSQLLNHLLADAPNSTVVHILSGEQYDRENRTAEAIEEFKIAEAMDSTMPLLHFGLGYLYWEQKDYVEAAKEFRLEVTAKNGEAALAKAFLGDIALRRGDVAAAEKLFDEALREGGHVRLAHYDLGTIYAGRRQFDQAIREFQQAIRLDSQQADAYYRLARVYRQQGRMAKAQTMLTKVQQLHAGDRATMAHVLVNDVTNQVQQ